MTPADTADDVETAATAAAPTATRRTSRQRTAVSERLATAEGFRSAQEIYAELRSAGNPIGLATVYRALQGMVEDGEVDTMRTAADGEAVYRRCSTRHHHHLVCRSCGRAVEIEAAEVEDWTRQVAARHGFTTVGHVLEVFGTCASCTADLPRDP